MLALSRVPQSPEARFRTVVPTSRRERDAPRAPTPELPSPRTNRILAGIPATSYHRVLAHLQTVTMKAGEALYEPGCKPRHVYFPTTSIVSLMSDTADGKCGEICAVGNEGVLGFALFLGGETTCSRAVVLNAGHGYRLESAQLMRELALSPPLFQLLLRYTQTLITHMTQSAVCIRHHTVDQQLCCRLLLSHDRLPSDELTMTHEQIASLLGVRRECITAVAGRLKDAHLIQYFRGSIRILDRPGLEARACECYEIVKRESDRLLASRLRDAALTA